MNTVLFVKKETTLDQLVDIITAEYRVYQVEDMKDDMIYNLKIWRAAADTKHLTGNMLTE